MTTIAPDYSGWAGWNLRANWPFFESLMAHYDPIARTDQHILWVPSQGRGAVADARCSLAASGPNRLKVSVSAEASGIASVYLERPEPVSQHRSAMLTVVEDSPFTRAATEPAWSDFPRYGVANEPMIALAAPVEPGETTRLTLELIDGSSIGSAQCFTRVFADFDFTALPSLTEGLDDYIEGVRP